MFAEVMVSMSPSVRRFRVLALLGLLLGAVGSLAIPQRAWAQEEDPVVLQKITDLNKKALEAYESLDFEQARKLLKDALDACAGAGLDKHPIKARTHIHMGAVLFGGFKQRDLAVKQFKKAIEIEPEIKLTKSVATPEVQAAFEEAKASAPAGDTSAPPPDGSGGGSSEPAPPSGPPPEVGEGLSHSPIRSGKRGQALTVTATVAPNVEAVAKVILAYRGEGAGDFMAREMTKSGNSYSGEIPEAATNGGSVSYFIEAQSADEAVVVAAGSADAPFTVTLSGSSLPPWRPPVKKSKDDDDEDVEGGPRIFLGLGGGLGFGSTSGSGEVLTNQKASGFAPASAGHLQLELGYFVVPQFRLSLQSRIQFVSGANGYFDQSRSGQCGSDNYCSPANGAFAVLARGSYFLATSGLVRPYLGVALGGGQIRHVESFKGASSCGVKGTEACKDSVLAGPVFIGPHGGFLLSFGRAGIVVELATQLGFPKFTFNIDVNGGLALTF